MTTVVQFEARGSTKEFMSYRGTEVLLSGPAGSGKTVAALMKLHLTALQVPGLRGLILRKTHASLTATTLATFDQIVAKDALAAGIVQFYGGSARAPASYTYSNGSVILVGGLDRGPEKYLSLEVDRVFIDEAIQVTEADVETLLTRLRGKASTYKQLSMCTNPAQPTHWLKQRCDRGATRILYSTYRDNPYFTNRDGSLTVAGEDYMAKLDGLSGVRRKRLLDGLWCAADGLIYEDWDPAVHLVDPFPIPASWTRWWSVDFGYTNPAVIQCWAEDEDGRLYLYRELYRTRTLVEDHAKQILSLVAPGGKWVEPRPRAVICDHDAEDRATLEKHLGLSTRAAKKTVSDGIQAVQARLRAAGDGKPRVFILRDCLVERDPELEDSKKPCSTVEEITGYVWDQTEGKPPKETPVKENDHGCLVAGTLVNTPGGPVPIEAIRPGQLVLTRSGPRPVLAAGMTSASAAVLRVQMSTGDVLVGTGDHPVWVVGEGWKRLDALRYQDRLLACQTSKASGSAGSSSAATPTPKTGRKGTTSSRVWETDSAAWGASTKRSGKRPTALSPRAAKSTTPTTTRSTTTWKTSCALPSPSTRRPTGNGGGNVPAHPSFRLTLNGSGPLRWLGITRKKAGPGIVSTPPDNSSAAESRASKPASSAARVTRPRPQIDTIGSVPTSARARGGARAAQTTNSASADIAAPGSPSTATTQSSAAIAHVLSVSALSEPAPVYNLTVADQPEYYASGVLVHNCDAMRYMVAQRDLVVSEATVTVPQGRIGPRGMPSGPRHPRGTKNSLR